VTRIAGVVSAHNQERWIAASIESLLPEVDELIVVDDGSADGTGAVIASLAARHGFRVITNTRARGVSEAYNAAVRATEAEVLLIQGGDDVAIAGRGARTAAALRDAGITLVHSLPIVIDALGRRLPEDAAGEFLAGATMKDPLPYLFNTGNYVCAPSAGLRRRDYLDAGGFPSNVDALQDYALWLELAARGGFQCEPEPLVQYRKHTSNLSREATGVDSRRRRREAAEDAWIRNRFLDRADPETLARVAPTPGSPHAGKLTRDEQAMLVRLSHEDNVIVRRGLSDLFDLLADEGDGALSRLGISRSDLGIFASRADHSGLAGLGRAKAVLSALTADDR
jgi:glycosyltransferase involved in cell wall biosynthesis